MTVIHSTTEQRQAKLQTIIDRIDVDVAKDRQRIQTLEARLYDEGTHEVMQAILGIDTKDSIRQQIEAHKEEIAFNLEARAEFVEELEMEKNHGIFDDE